MCGIVGQYYFDPSRHVTDESVRAMCRTITHRGPDGEGVFLDKNLGMGMRRLAVVDLEGGKQPVFNETGDVAVVFNGEIYNYPELKAALESDGHLFRTKSDTEVLVHGYESWGEALPERLNGMFAFSLWDAPRRRLFLSRDHIGVKPLYVYQDSHMVAWASEIKALLAVPGIVAELDELALLDYLSFGYVPAPRTMFRNIKKLPPASTITIEGDRVHQSQYWDLDFCEESRSEADWCDEIRALLDTVVRRQLMSDVPLGAFLSGGIDSSSIVSTMHQLGVSHIATYAIGFDGADSFHSELDKAQIVARAFHTDHHEIVVSPDVSDLLFPLIRHLDEPVTDTSFLVTYLVSRLARETVTVILSGLGGDEIFGGYRRYLWPQLQQLYNWVPSVVDRHVVQPIVRRLPIDRGSAMRASFRHLRGFLEHADQPDSRRYQGYVGVFRNGHASSLLTPDLARLQSEYVPDQVSSYYRSAKASDPLGRMLYADMKTSLVDSLLTFTDKMSMAVSLEARVPLLDYKLVELAARIPSKLKLNGLRGLKYIFKRAMSDRLPESIMNRKKQGFGTPISRWFRDSLNPLVQDLLSPDQLNRRGYFRPDAVSQLIEDHAYQRADYSEHIMALLSLEIWHQIYLTNN